MRRIWMFAMLWLLVGCTNEVDPVSDDPPDDNPQEEEVLPVDCTEQDSPVVLEATATLDVALLVSHSVICDGLVWNETGITLADGQTQGTLMTGWFEVPRFTELVPSWNIEIDDSVKVRIRLLVDETDETGILMGYWTSSYKASLSYQDTPYGQVAIDTFRPAEPRSRFALRITFEGGAATLKNLSITTREDHSFGGDAASLEEVSLTLPPLAQLSIPGIGNAICSPTSLAMVLQYYGQMLSPTQTAAAVRDQGADIYGNWSFNASFAGGFSGLHARVEAINDLATMVSYLQEGIPLVLSIKTSSIQELDGAIMAYPAGHLVVLAGFANLEDVWYARVYDPAAHEDDDVLRYYPLEQLLSAYQGYAYVVRDTAFPTP